MVKTRVHLVVPHTWINGIKSLIEGFMNNGVNSNRKFAVFWPDSPEAFDANGITLVTFEPTIPYNENDIDTHNFPEEGWYHCQIRRFKCKYL